MKPLGALIRGSPPMTLGNMRGLGVIAKLRPSLKRTFPRYLLRRLG